MLSALALVAAVMWPEERKSENLCRTESILFQKFQITDHIYLNASLSIVGFAEDVLIVYSRGNNHPFPCGAEPSQFIKSEKYPVSRMMRLRSDLRPFESVRGWLCRLLHGRHRFSRFDYVPHAGNHCFVGGGYAEIFESWKEVNTDTNRQVSFIPSANDYGNAIVHVRAELTFPYILSDTDGLERGFSGYNVQYERYNKSESGNEAEPNLPYCRPFLPFSSPGAVFGGLSGPLLSLQISSIMLLGLAFNLAAALGLVGAFYYADRKRKALSGSVVILGAGGGLTFWGWAALGHPLVIWGLCQSWAS